MFVRKIIHLDLDAFFCAVEEIYNPELRRKPFAVGGRPDSRGVVSSCSYAARQFGIRSAMPMASAIKICPELLVLSGSYKKYQEASNRVMNFINNLTPVVEQISIDEAFMDVSDLSEAGVVLAKNLQDQIYSELQLPCSIGIATNKLVAKIATDVGKSRYKRGDYPMAIEEVLPGKESEYLAPLHVERMWGIGVKTAAKLNKMGIFTIGDLAKFGENRLEKEFGVIGMSLARHALGLDDSPVGSHHERKSISQERTFVSDVVDKEIIRKKIHELSEQVAFTLRQKGLCATTVRLKLRWSDFTTFTRQISLDKPTNVDSVISSTVIQLLDSNWNPAKKIRLVGVGVNGLGKKASQLSLFETPDDKEHKLLTAIDALKDRYGKDVIRKGSH